MYRTDSRKVKKNDIFIALRGISKDGHDYIPKAIENKASKIICEYGNYSIPYVTVKDTRKYMEDLLKEEYKEKMKNLKIIGVTGTNGKSTIAYFLYQLLNKSNHKAAYVGTVGFYLDGFVEDTENTTPDLCDLYEYIDIACNKNVEYLILEVSSQGLAYGRVNKIDFDCAIFTNLTLDHLDFHKTMENYALAKQKLFKQSKCGIINVDDEYSNYFLLDDKINITYGFNSNDYKLQSFNEQVLKYNDNNILTNLKTLYNAYNLLAVIACLDYFKIDNYKDNIKDLELPDGRYQEIEYKNGLIIIDYAHTPDAIEKLIKSFKNKKIVTIFGCTGDRLKDKRPIMGNLATELSYKVIITKDNINSENIDDINNDIIKGIEKDNYEVINDRALAIKKGISYITKDTVLLILGKGHEKYMEENHIKFHFNDYEEVMKVIGEEDASTC